MVKKIKKERGVTIAVSPEAYELMSVKAFNSKPRMTLREYVNSINGLSLGC